MTPANLLFTIAGIGALLVGLVMLLRPSLVRALLRIKPSEPAKQGLLIAGMMLAAFGMLLAGFAIGYSTVRPLDFNQSASQ
ncbi:hypothetical protein [Sphingomonas sp.]|uniref:hypothetical protein n=1 Tax=Sphingomonas sp. TaxID=28214 RepID=UPI0025D4B3CA|nr:hypothetical protein [Sphingomonas sp.]